MRRACTRIRSSIGITISSQTAPPTTTPGSPNRLLTAFELPEFVGCHEETARRADLRGLLVSQRFGVRSRRFRTDTRVVINEGSND
jgi:hypothetical protein